VRAASLGQLSRATTSTVPNLVGAVSEGVPAAAAGIQLDIPKVPLTSYSMSKELLKGSQIRITSGLGVSSQVRCLHAGNMDVPDFSYYRRSAVKDSAANSSESAADRKGFSYMMAAGLGVAGAYGGKSIVNQFISSWSASQDVLALAKIEIKLGDIPEGKNMTFKWEANPCSFDTEPLRRLRMKSLSIPQPSVIPNMTTIVSRTLSGSSSWVCAHIWDVSLLLTQENLEVITVPVMEVIMMPVEE